MFKNVLPLIVSLFFSSIIYFGINYATYHDPLAFQKSLSSAWYKNFDFPWKGIVSSWKRGLFTQEWSNYKIIIGYAEAITSTIAWIFAFVSFLKKIKVRFSYSLYYLLGTIFFTSTGFILSSPRYLLSLPPFFIILAKLTKVKPLRAAWIIFSVSLLFYFSYELAVGHWAF